MEKFVIRLNQIRDRYCAENRKLEPDVKHITALILLALKYRGTCIGPDMKNTVLSYDYLIADLRCLLNQARSQNRNFVQHCAINK